VQEELEKKAKPAVGLLHKLLRMIDEVRVWARVRTGERERACERARERTREGEGERQSDRLIYVEDFCTNCLVEEAREWKGDGKRKGGRLIKRVCVRVCVCLPDDPSVLGR